MSKQTRLGVDTGGTFTDFVWLDENGRFHVHKQLSTPEDPSQAILTGINQLGVPETAVVIHGSTVATNALLERRGARTALITTAGFADILAIGRQNRPDLYALVPQKPQPLVPRQWRYELSERVTAQGDILIPLDPKSLSDILSHLAAEKIESVAICFLFSYLRPEHEQQARQAIHKTLGADFPVSLSSEILPEYREYERTATTVINAYVTPVMRRYLTRLATQLKSRRLAIIQSNGGVIPPETAASQAARTVLSGPAGGVVGARYIATLAGFEEIITFDMGGTSTDVALCPGRIPTTTEGEIAGMPLRLPVIDIHTVGAGGGSLAYVDAGGALHVGPQSAGADPGPACYGRIPPNWSLTLAGVTIRQPVTVTDANLVLGRLDANHFLGQTMQLDLVAARRSLADLAVQMGVATPEEAAWGVIQVANANMERAVRRISVERGFDPRRFTLVAFGGAGPLHACELAASLQIPRVLIPPVPGVLSALGMLAAHPTRDYSRAVLRQVVQWSPDLAGWLGEVFAALRAKALSDMAADGYDVSEVVFRYALDMRYVGQSHELTVPLAVSAEAGVESPVEVFHQAHERRYGYQRPEAAVELVTARLTAVFPITPPAIFAHPAQKDDPSSARLGTKQVWFDGQPITTSLYQRERLQPGNRFAGPAVVFQYDTTTVVPPGWETAVDSYGNLVLTARPK
ncbi:MAG: hydantoinase/oxoprolinase family protein [Chloroflexi bacterium]|nr:MAG: hydantoinase/oxoprolinase family protein [Chloroflexota bacterium]